MAAAADGLKEQLLLQEEDTLNTRSESDYAPLADGAADDDVSEPPLDPRAWCGWLRRLRRSPRGVLIVVALALFVDLMVYCIIIPVLPLFVEKHLDGSSSAIGALFACYAAGLLLATPAVAWWSDRSASRAVPMIMGLCAMIASSLMFGLATELWQLCLARFSQGVSAAVSNTIGLAMLADVYPNSQLPEAMAAAMAVTGLGGMAGPPIGGALYQHVSYVSVFLVCGGLALLDLLLRLLLIDDAWMNRQRERIKRKALADEAAEDKAAAEAAAAPVAAPLVVEISSATAGPEVSAPSAQVHPIIVVPASTSGADTVAITTPHARGSHQTISLWGLAQVRQLQVTFVAVAILSTVFTGLEPLLALHFNDDFGSSSAMIGLSYFSIAIPYSISSAIVAPLQERGTNPKLLIGTGMAVLAAALACLPLPRSLAVSLAPMAGVGIGIGAAMAPPLGEIGEWLTRTRNQGAFAQGFALFNLAYAVGMFAGPLLSGNLYDYTSFVATMMVMAGLCAAGALLLLVVGAQERRRKGDKNEQAAQQLGANTQREEQQINSSA